MNTRSPWYFLQLYIMEKHDLLVMDAGVAVIVIFLRVTEQETGHLLLKATVSFR